MVALLKNQVDNLVEAGIAEAVTVNGLLDPIGRANSYQRVQNGTASILYISPEQLHSRTIEKMLLSRNIVRFVIDEAHCFSAWGQDFRVDFHHQVIAHAGRTKKSHRYLFGNGEIDELFLFISLVYLDRGGSNG